MAVTAALQWTKVGELPEPALHPQLIHDEENNTIYIMAKINKDCDYYFAYNIETKQCIKDNDTDIIQKNRDKIEITDNVHDKVRFGQFGEIYINVKGEDTDKWYKTHMMSYDMDWICMYCEFNNKFKSNNKCQKCHKTNAYFNHCYVGNYGYIITENNKYLILFGGIISTNGDAAILNEIKIFDLINFKWYKCKYRLPRNLSFISCIQIPIISHCKIECILSYFIRNNLHNLLILKFSMDIMSMIIKYTLNHNIYIFGGHHDEMDLTLCEGKDIFCIDLCVLLDNKTIFQCVYPDNFQNNVIVKTAQCKFYDVSKNQLECAVCYDPGRQCVIDPCLCFVSCLECFMEDLWETCPICSNEVYRLFRVMC